MVVMVEKCGRCDTVVTVVTVDERIQVLCTEINLFHSNLLAPWLSSAIKGLVHTDKV